MSTHPQPEAVPLRLLHPVWCCLGPGCLEVGRFGEHNVVHRSKATKVCQTKDVVMTLNRIRCDTPRFIDLERRVVNGQGEPAPDRPRESVELTLTQGDVTIHAGDLGVSELRELMVLIEQQLAYLRNGPFPRDYPRAALTH